MEKYINRETETRKLVYGVDFRQWMKEHPEAVKDFLDFVNGEEFTDSKEGDVIETDKMRVTVLQKEQMDQHTDEDRGPRFKFEVEGEIFFIKMEKVWAKGHEEAMSTERARKLLKNIPKVEIYEPQLGYQTDTQSFFVSKWIDLPLLRIYMDKLSDDNKKEKAERHRLYLRSLEITKVLEEFHDANFLNMFYDSDTDTIILFDIAEFKYLDY